MKQFKCIFHAEYYSNLDAVFPHIHSHRAVDCGKIYALWKLISAIIVSSSEMKSEQEFQWHDWNYDDRMKWQRNIYNFSFSYIFTATKSNNNINNNIYEWDCGFSFLSRSFCYNYNAMAVSMLLLNRSEIPTIFFVLFTLVFFLLFKCFFFRFVDISYVLCSHFPFVWFFFVFSLPFFLLGKFHRVHFQRRYKRDKVHRKGRRAERKEIWWIHMCLAQLGLSYKCRSSFMHGV